MEQQVTLPGLPIEEEKSDRPVPPTESVAMFERLAKDPAVPVEKLKELVALQERVLAWEARREFDTAFAAMAGELPIVEERGKAERDRAGTFSYARLEDLVAATRPVLQKHGFYVNFRTEWPSNDMVKVVSILTHRSGHFRTSEFLTKADTGPGRNAIQSLGSAITYAKRYTLRDLLNIASRESDDDGVRAGSADAKRPAPVGYDDWLMDIEAVAAEGTPALMAAWKRSPEVLRLYLQETNRQYWDNIKLRAAKATADLAKKEQGR